jgi:hypothetical protein
VSGANRRTFAHSRAAPRDSSSADSSSALAVVRGTMFVIPSPKESSSRSSNGESRRGVKPESSSAGQNRLPGRAKWCPTAAEYSPGLMPTNNTRSPRAIKSGTVPLRASCNSRGEGFHGTEAERLFTSKTLYRVLEVAHAAEIRPYPLIVTSDPRGANVAAPRTSGGMADAPDLGSGGATRGGSSPSSCTQNLKRFSLLQPFAAAVLPIRCPKLRSSIASRSALGARCMYLSVIVSVECPASS